MLIKCRYERTLCRIQSNPYDNQKAVAWKILSLITCSKRPLKWREIQAAVSINVVDQILDSDQRLPFHIKEICGSLVEILPEDRIEFVHVTATLSVIL